MSKGDAIIQKLEQVTAEFSTLPVTERDKRAFAGLLEQAAEIVRAVQALDSIRRVTGPSEHKGRE